jgi:hypothetical protein
MSLQDLIDQKRPGQSLILEPPNQEFKGPIVVRRPLVLQGQGATIRAARGPVVTVETAGVHLRDVNLEVTTDPRDLSDDEACALVVTSAHDLTTKNVTLRGSVVGVPGEGGRWRYPHSIRLGTLTPRREHAFRLRLALPVPCRLLCDIDGFRIDPPASTGRRTIECTLHIEKLTPGVRLRGSLQIHTANFAQQIAITGNAARTEAEKQLLGDGQLIYDCLDPRAKSACSAAAAAAEPAAPHVERPPASDVIKLGADAPPFKEPAGQHPTAPAATQDKPAPAADEAIDAGDAEPTTPPSSRTLRKSLTRSVPHDGFWGGEPLTDGDQTPRHAKTRRRPRSARTRSTPLPTAWDAPAVTADPARSPAPETIPVSGDPETAPDSTLTISPQTPPKPEKKPKRVRQATPLADVFQPPAPEPAREQPSPTAPPDAGQHVGADASPPEQQPAEQPSPEKERKRRTVRPRDMGVFRQEPPGH